MFCALSLSWWSRAFWVAALLLLPKMDVAQQPTAPFTLSVSAREVSLSFSALDEKGLGVANLTTSDLSLEDDRAHQKIASLRYYEDLPILAAFLFDTSSSMVPDLEHNVEIAQMYAAQILKRGKDQAFVSGFDTQVKTTQD